MINYKKLRKEIKQLSTRSDVADILRYVGYEVNNDFKFRLRADENTPSASISKLGQITDFGTGWSGDIVSVLYDFHGISLGEATVYSAKLLNIDVERFDDEKSSKNK